MEKETQRQMITFGFALSAIVVGTALNLFGIKGNTALMTFGSVGNWLLVLGLLSLLIAQLKRRNVFGARQQVDERVEFLSARASKIVFLALILAAFAIMIADALAPITLPYHLMMSYLICGAILTYASAYTLLEKRY